MYLFMCIKLLFHCMRPLFRFMIKIVRAMSLSHRGSANSYLINLADETGEPDALLLLVFYSCVCASHSFELFNGYFNSCKWFTCKVNLWCLVCAAFVFTVILLRELGFAQYLTAWWTGFYLKFTFEKKFTLKRRLM